MNFAKYLLLALLTLGSCPAGAALWQWSLTSSSNGSADPTINWAVGSSPTSVEGSGRAMLARIAEYRDDISGALVTGGTATAYTVTTNQSTGGNGICGTGTVPTNGQMVTVTPNLTNGINATLRVDGCTAASIRSAGAPVVAGVMIAGTPYGLMYSTANSAWMLRNFYGLTLAVPLGGIIATTATAVPNSNFILPAGQCISTTTYATYWALLGSPAPGACGAGLFAVVDMRGSAAVALDNLNGSAANRMTSAATGCGTAFTSVGATCANASQSQLLTATQLPSGITAANGSQSITVTGAVGSPIYGDGSIQTFGAYSAGSTLVGGSFGQMTVSGTISISATSNNTSGTAHPNVQPSVALVYLLRVM